MEPPFRRRLQTTPQLLRLRGVVVSVGGKGVAETRSGRAQGDERKRTAEDVSKKPDVVETRGASNLWDEPAGDLSTVQAATGI